MSQIISAITLRQPWPFLIFDGLPDGRSKSFEIRTWRLPFRKQGTTLICAGKAIDFEACERFDLGPEQVAQLALGCAYGTVNFSGCLKMAECHEESSLVPWDPEKWAWWMTERRKLARRFPVSGKQGFFTVDVERFGGLTYQKALESIA